MKKKKASKTMDEITQGFEKFIEGKEVNKDNKPLFEKAIKKAVKSGSK